MLLPEMFLNFQRLETIDRKCRERTGMPRIEIRNEFDPFVRRQPLVQACSVIVTFQIVAVKIEVGECMRPVHDYRDAVLATEPADIPDRKNLACQKYDVATQHHARLRRDRSAEYLDQLRQIL